MINNNIKKKYNNNLIIRWNIKLMTKIKILELKKNIINK